MNLDDNDDRSVASAEFVLGTLEPEDATAFENRLRTDAALANQVGYWQDRLLPLVGRVSPVTPSPQLWSRIESDVDADLATRAASSATVSPDASPAIDEALPASVRTAPRGPAPVSIWERLGWWRALSGFAVAASLVLAVLLARDILDPAPASIRYVAVLQSSDGKTGWLVQAAGKGPVQLVPLVPSETVPAGRSWQFWTKPEGASGPTSLGLVPAGSTFEVARDRLPGLENEQLFEITLEPEQGSPIGRPTGPVLFIGKGRRI